MRAQTNNKKYINFCVKVISQHNWAMLTFKFSATFVDTRPRPRPLILFIN